MSGAQGGSHSLAFRVMRLCRPSFQIDHVLKFDPIDLMVGEDFFDDQQSAVALSTLLAEEQSKEKENYWRRFELESPLDAMGLTGLLVLPQAFGAIYLGETFCSYVSVGNHSSYEVRDVAIKAEVLYALPWDIKHVFSSPIDRLWSAMDIMLVCTAVYTDADGERKYLPQFFKFMVANPLSVRTKVRSVKPIPHKEIDLQIVELPSHIILERPFLVRVRLKNHTDKRIGPLEVSLSQDDGLGSRRAIVVTGLWTLIVPQLEAFGSTDFNLSLVATSLGVQKISGIMVFDARERKPYDTLQTIEVFVNPE